MSSSVDSDHLKFTDSNHGEQRGIMVLSDLDTRHKEEDHVSLVLYDADGKTMAMVSMDADDAMTLAVALFKHAARVAQRPWPYPSTEEES